MTPFAVLFVCSANLCRSVTAAALMSRALEESPSHPEWRISSAGLDVRSGAMLPPPIADVMHQCGVSLETPPRQLDLETVQRTDLVLTAERGQRARVVRAVPSVGRRIFTIRQFARLCAAGREATGVGFTGSGVDLLDLARTGRMYAQPVEPTLDDIPDPTSIGTEAAMWKCVATIEDSIRHIVSG